MNKSSVIALGVVAAVVLGGGAFALSSSQSKKSDNAQSTASSSVPIESAATKSMQEDNPMASDDTMLKKDSAVSLVGSYSDYEGAKLANAANGDVVLYFNAPWCPTCKEANKNFLGSKTPDGLTLLKVDYDSSTELKKKYGVTYQHTFVQVDKDGNKVKKWNGSRNYTELNSQIN